MSVLSVFLTKKTENICLSQEPIQKAGASQGLNQTL